MSAVRLGLVFGSAALVAAVALFPLRLALDWSGASAAGLFARQVEGPVWAGELHDASLAGVPLGVVKAGLDPLALATGAVRLRFDARGAVSGGGTVGFGGRGIALEGADLEAPLLTVFPGLALRGRLQLSDAAVRFQSGRCTAARGGAVIDRLGVGARGPDVPGLQLAGRLGCRDGALVIPLTGQSAGVRFDGSLRVEGAGAWRLESRVRVTDPTVEAALGLSGFGRTLDGFGRVDQGRLGHAGA